MIEIETPAPARSEAHFTVSYDGPAVAGGTMDVRELAPALLSLGALCERVNELVNGPDSQISVRVQAGAKRGSFPVDIQVITDLVQALVDGASGANKILELLGISGGAVGLFSLIKSLRGRRPEKVAETPKGVTILIGSVELNIDRLVYALYKDDEARRHARGVVRPLGGPGVRVIEFKEGESIRERVTEEDIESFEAATGAPEGEQIVPPTETISAFEIARLPLTRSGRKWLLKNPSMRAWAVMEDDAFKARMNAREERFAVGDILIVRLRTEITQDAEGKLHTMHGIVEVLDHRAPPQQMRMKE